MQAPGSGVWAVEWWVLGAALTEDMRNNSSDPRRQDTGEAETPGFREQESSHRVPGLGG